jgi:hypothetical protein
MILQEDRDALSAIKDYKTPVYKPANDAYTLDKLVAAQAAMVVAGEWGVHQQTEADRARDATVAAEWGFHKTQI